MSILKNQIKKFLRQAPRATVQIYRAFPKYSETVIDGILDELAQENFDDGFGRDMP